MIRRSFALGVALLMMAGAGCSVVVRGGGSSGGSGSGGSGGSGSGGSGGSGGVPDPGTGSTGDSGGGPGMPPTCPPADTCLGAPAGQSCGPNAACDGTGHCLITLASGQYQPGSIAVDASHVYWLNASTSNPMGGLFSDGTLMSCGRDGCGQKPTTLATGQASPRSIAVDAMRVYWSNSGINGYGTDGSLMMCAAGGCGSTPTALLGNIRIAGLAVDASRAYWTSTGNGSGTVWSCDKGGCVPQPLANVDGLPFNVAVNATTLAWTASKGALGGSVWTCTPSACMPEELVVGDAPSALTLDATNAYFTTQDAVMKCAIAGCNNQPTTLAQGLGWPSSIATDGVDVYFTVGVMGQSGAVMKCAVDGCKGSPTVIAAGPGILSPRALTVDATGVYWTDDNAGTVMKAPFGPPCSPTARHGRARTQGAIRPPTLPLVATPHRRTASLRAAFVPSMRKAIARRWTQSDSSNNEG